MQLPGLIQRLVGSAEFSLTDTIEEPTVSPPFSFRFTTVPSVFPDKTTVTGTVTIEPVGSSRCRQTVAGSVTVAVWGMGSAIEKFIVTGLSDSYAKLPTVIDAWKQVRLQHVGLAGRAAAARADDSCSGEATVYHDAADVLLGPAEPSTATPAQHPGASPFDRRPVLPPASQAASRSWSEIVASVLCCSSGRLAWSYHQATSSTLNEPDHEL